METLGKIFGTENKVKIMRLFLFNPDSHFDINTIADRVNSTSVKIRRDLSVLEKAKFIRKRGKSKKKKTNFALNKDFTYIIPLQNFLLNASHVDGKEIIKKFAKLGSVKLIILAGVFIQNPESRADLVIVGDGISKARLESHVRVLESELGKELKYAYFTTEDFKYRLGMFDKLTRDILDYPHKKVLNRLGLA